MTDRHIFHDHTTLVVRSLKGLVATHPHLSVIPSQKIVYHANHDPSKVSLICVSPNDLCLDLVCSNQRAGRRCWT